MRFKVLMLVAVVLALSTGIAVGQRSDDGFLDLTPVWQGIDYSGIHYRYKDIVLEQRTGHVLMVFEEFDPVTYQATGRIAVQYRRDTKMGKCMVSPELAGFAVPCDPYMMIAP